MHETSRAVQFAPTEHDSHGGKDTMWKIKFNFKNNVIMNNSLFNDFAARFAVETLESLIESFNRQVGNRGWASVRAAYDMALIKELICRGIDVSAVYDGKSISFARHVVLDNNCLVIAE